VRPALWLRTISRLRAQHCPAPGFGYALCVNRIRDEDMTGVDLSSWRYALNGSEPVSMDVIRRFTERFSQWGFRASALTPVYGLAEAALAVTFGGVDEPPQSIAVDPVTLAASGQIVPGSMEIASVGRPVAGVELEVRDEDGLVLGERQVGRIFVRSPSVMTGYYNDREATERALENGWLDTGDLGFVADRSLYICGRAKDIVIIRGANYTSQAFEACLATINGLQPGGALAVGFVPADGEGEELLVLAERSPRQVGDESAVIGAIHQAILLRMGIRPHTIELVNPGTLPRTSSGKLRRADALRRWLSGALRLPTAQSPSSLETVHTG
jgi:acyl-CoA synthetase (AMP-forming)/AMP-acid ligase II